LDEALLGAQEDKAHANFFYDAFLNASLYFPVQKLGSETGDWRELGMTDRFQPLFLSFTESKAVPVFDTLPRMKEWADQKSLDFVILKGFQLLKITNDKMGIILNLGTPFHYTLTPEVLALLRNTMKPITPS